MRIIVRVRKMNLLNIEYTQKELLKLYYNNAYKFLKTNKLLN